MRVLRLLKPFLCCGEDYRTVRTDDEEHTSCDLTPLPRGLRRRVMTSLKEHETVWYFEKNFHTGTFIGYVVVALLPVGLWGYLLFLHLTDNRRMVDQIWLLAVGCCLAILCAIMTLNSSRMCSTANIFTSRRMMWGVANGPLRWILYDDVEMPSDLEDKVAKFRVTGSGNGGGPLHELTFHYVSDLPALDAMVYSERWRAHQLEAGGCCVPDEVNTPMATSLKPQLAEQIKALLQPGEQLLWCQQPFVHHVAPFTIPLLVLLLTNIPWLLWVGTGDTSEYTLVLQASSIAGIVCSILLAIWEGMICRVVYFLTTHTLSVYYLHSAKVLSFPLNQLKSVGTWPEGGRSGSATFLFRCDNTSAQCLAVQQRLGLLAARHVRAVSENIWFLRLKDWAKFSESVLGRTQVAIEISDPACTPCGDEAL